jgi:medium-chain acyl-[acyl-carrier-protein] hydrolase
MKIEKTHRVGLFDIDYQFKLRIEAAARFFQDIAVHHSTGIGAGPDVLLKKGLVWFLSRLEIEFFRYPTLGEDLRIVTWSRGFKGFKGYREYLIDSSQGKVARGSGVWLFYDFMRKRIIKVPPEISGLYEIEQEKWFDNEIDDWVSTGRIEPEHETEVSLRYSDVDVNGHVNNTVYFGFLETLYHKTMMSNGQSVKNLKIRFSREIDKDREHIRVGAKKVNGVYICNICDNSELYAEAEIIPMG